MSEVKQFKLPDVGEGLTEADIVSWRVKPGDPVHVNQVIVEIETAKSLVELPCPFDGVVRDLLVSEGQTVDVGVPILAVDVFTEGAAEAELPEALRPPPSERAVEPGMEGSPAPKAERQAVLVGYGVKLGPTKRRPRKPAPAPPSAGNGGRALAKPPVRKMAKDMGVDLSSVAGSGPGGVITREDVEAAAAAPAALAAARRPGGPAGVREERVAVRGVRKHTAAAVTSSAFTAPHVTEFLQIDMTESMAALERLRAMPDFSGVRLSPLLLVAKALLIAVARHPMINSSWDEQAQEIVVKRYVNLGIAAATERGLLVPNIKNAHAMSLPGLAGALSQLAATAREGKTQPADQAGGTISITNVGVFGVDAGTPILTPGEAAILAFGQVRDAPWVHQGQLAVRKVTTLSLSFDHRVVDGDLGSAVLRDVGAMLTDPVAMLAWS